ncbi:MAG: 39S ribosomal protein L44, mitochondrial, partial [Paramarteilia canceri]
MVPNHIWLHEFERVMKESGKNKIEARIMRKAGANTITALYVIGIYADFRQLGY